MSKKVEPAKPAEAPAVSRAEEPKQFIRAVLGDCRGKRVKCPSCSKLAEVEHARGGMLRNQPVSSKFWMRLDCSGCGARLERITQPVEVEVGPKPPPDKRKVGHVVSQFVKCPIPDCGQRSRVNWTIDDGHVVDCPIHQRRVTDPETEVEILA